MASLRVVEAGTVPYLDAWERQRTIHAGVVAGTQPDTVLLLEHPAVYTAGRRTEPWERPGAGRPGGAAGSEGPPVIDVDRGGKITWHGPGQLVGYPILHLPDPVDVVAYVRRIETTLIAVCAEFGVDAVQVAGRSGVWLAATAAQPARKIAAIGVRVSHGVTMHGFALNCDCELSWADVIVPCGIADAGVTSLSAELGRPVGVAQVLPVVRRHLPALLASAPVGLSA